MSNDKNAGLKYVSVAGIKYHRCDEARMVLNVVKTYQGSETRRLTPDEHPTFVGVKGDTDACILKFVIPATHSAYTKQIRFDLKLTDADGNEHVPTYDLTNNAFAIPAEISNSGLDSMEFCLIFSDTANNMTEWSLPCTIWFGNSA